MRTDKTVRKWFAKSVATSKLVSCYICCCCAVHPELSEIPLKLCISLWSSCFIFCSCSDIYSYNFLQGVGPPFQRYKVSVSRVRDGLTSGLVSGSGLGLDLAATDRNLFQLLHRQISSVFFSWIRFVAVCLRSSLVAFVISLVFWKFCFTLSHELTHLRCRNYVVTVYCFLKVTEQLNIMISQGIVWQQIVGGGRF